ncbi:hypothetical protein C1645_836668 [Glomus cerebriforme]|uniref:TLDc domain-containing protein n=1 Tax=Glomus cerebriforme TaxID=658196 RepID=A0A397SGS6_9GLOM|nr:hypothetical protein C1645_836668 [Glomus cerebriforme]
MTPFKCLQEVANDHEKLLESNEEYDDIIYAEYLIKHQDEILQKTLIGILEAVEFSQINDLLMDEIDIWDNLIKWCLAQNPNIIIYGYELPRQFKCNSTLIEAEHFAIFSSWIEKKNNFYYVKYIPYNFNLLYRASSRDDNTATAFHTKCDKKEATIVVVKIADSEQIVGRYNLLFCDPDNNGHYKSTNDSFIFSFTNRDNFQTAKVGYSNGNQYSIYCFLGNGPVFGGGSDLCCNVSTWSSYRNGYFSYPKIDFYADDYEVFQVIKK